MSATDYSPANGSQRLDGPTTPPQNLEAEQSVLGAVLLSDTVLPALIIDERLQPDDFYRSSHGIIYAAMLALHSAGENIDDVTLVEHLKQNGQLERVGGRGAVDLLAASVPAVGNVRQYARIVRENAMLRRLLNARRPWHRTRGLNRHARTVPARSRSCRSRGPSRSVRRRLHTGIRRATVHAEAGRTKYLGGDSQPQGRVTRVGQRGIRDRR